MAQTTPLPLPMPHFALRRDLGSFLDSGQSFFSSLFSPDSTDINGETSVPTATTSAGRTAATAPTALTTKTTSNISNIQSTLSTARGAISSTGGLPSTTASTTTRSTLTPGSLSTTASAALSSSTPSNAASSNHSVKAGPIAAGVAIGIVFFLVIGLLAFAFIRRRRKKEEEVWKRMSQSVSLLAAESGGDPTVESAEEPKDFSLPSFPPPTASYDVVAPPQRRFSESRTPPGLNPVYPFPRYQEQNTAFVGPRAIESQRRRSSALDRRSEDAERANPHSVSRLNPGIQTRPPLPAALMAGRRVANVSSGNNGFSSVQGQRNLPRNTDWSDVKRGPGQVFAPTGDSTPSTPTEHRTTVKRKPVPKLDNSEPDARRQAQPRVDIHVTPNEGGT